jgi:hypothetical protein
MCSDLQERQTALNVTTVKALPSAQPSKPSAADKLLAAHMSACRTQSMDACLQKQHPMHQPLTCTTNQHFNSNNSPMDPIN